jgi:HEAT repeat protein
MTTRQILIIAAGTNLVLIIGLALGTALIKLRRQRLAVQREQELAKLRPVLLRYLATWEDGDASNLADTLIQHRSSSATFEDLVAGLLPKLRGADRTVLVDILRRRGTIARACRQTRHRLSLRRALSAELLGSAGAIEGVPHVARLLDDRNPQVRLAAVRALGRIGTTASAAALISHVDQKDPKIPPQPVTMALLRIGTDSAEPLLAALHAYRANVRTMAAEVLGVLGVIPAAGPLERMLGTDPDVGVRIGAAHALGRLGVPGSVAGLIHSLEIEMEDHPDVLGAVCLSIGQIGNPASIPALEWAIVNPEPSVRVSAATALRLMGDAGVEQLRLTAHNEPVRGDAAREVLARHLITAGAAGNFAR